MCVSFGCMACRILVLRLETEPMPMQWKGGVLAMTPLGKSLFVCAKTFTYFVCSASGAPGEIYGSGAPRKKLDHKPITTDHVRGSCQRVLVIVADEKIAARQRGQSEEGAWGQSCRALLSSGRPGRVSKKGTRERIGS